MITKLQDINLECILPTPNIIIFIKFSKLYMFQFIIFRNNGGRNIGIWAEHCQSFMALLLSESGVMEVWHDGSTMLWRWWMVSFLREGRYFGVCLRKCFQKTKPGPDLVSAYCSQTEKRSLFVSISGASLHCLHLWCAVYTSNSASSDNSFLCGNSKPHPIRLSHLTSHHLSVLSHKPIHPLSNTKKQSQTVDSLQLYNTLNPP